MAKKDKNREVDPTVKSKVLDLALTSINKKHASAVKWLSETPNEEIDFISTGSLSIDLALGGGFPRGRIVEIFGWESCGKSTLAMSVVAQANKRGLNCLYIDAERALDPRLPISYGVNPEMFILDDAPLCGEDHLDILESVVSSGNIGVAVVDSVSALTPRAVLEGSFGDQHVGLQARLLSQSLAKLVHIIGETNTLLLFINQYREKVMGYGDPKTTSGGNALRFYATHRVEVSGSGKSKGGALLNSEGDIMGHRMKCKVLKNKVGLPFRTGEVDLLYGIGFDSISELVDIGCDLGVVNAAGAWFSYKTIEKVQGRDKFKSLIAGNAEIRRELKSEIEGILNNKKKLQGC